MVSASHDLVSQGANVSTTTGKIGNGIHVDNSLGDSCLSGDDSFLPDNVSPRSITAWVKYTPYSTLQFYTQYGSPGTGNNVAVGASSAGSPFLSTWASDWSISGTDLSDGSWHFEAVTFDGTTWKWYDNATLLTSLTFVTTNTTLQGTDGLRIGCWSSAAPGSQDWKGDIDEVAFYSSVLSSGEITTLYNGGTGMNDQNGTDILAYYSFDGDSLLTDSADTDFTPPPPPPPTPNTFSPSVALFLGMIFQLIQFFAILVIGWLAIQILGIPLKWFWDSIFKLK